MGGMTRGKCTRESKIVFPKVEEICKKIKEQNRNSKWYEEIHIKDLILQSFEVRQAAQLIDDANN